MTAPSPKVLLFDLGGVIVPWVGLEALAARSGLTREAVVDRFAASDVFNAYERGEVSSEAFLVELATLFNLPNENLAALWNSWVEPPYPGTLAALASLRSRFTLACLSNTNALHWAHLGGIFDLSATFYYAFASHEIRAAKPDLQSYRIPLARMGVAASEVWFFDDTRINVEAARAVGMTAHHVDRTVGVLPTLRHLGLLPD